ncbi:MAG: DNA helicase RecQ [Oscillibacter sp.]|nr:DNA helicase RecQ [Oscillibacter sp.]
MDKLSVLKQYFGHDAFRPGQETLVDAVLSGRDVLGIMPTGGGKSLCYQIPALLLPGVTLVISPLISLMKDQVAALTAAGVSAAFLNSSQDLEESRQVWSAVRREECRLLYVAPERLENQRFLELMESRDIRLVAVDEAHCISQWGQDFRPSYLKIADFVSALPKRPVVAAFTATATARVQEDIAARLGLRDPVRMVTGFDRPNLYFDVQRPGRKKLPALISLLSERRGRSGIIYCATRSAVERVCETLEGQGFSATRYHAGLSEEERRENQDDFQFDRKQIMVATNAFGMGIDKSNVSFVIHYNMPKNLESYYQEAGRAGRDGEPADCILLYSAGDVATAKVLLSHSEQGPEPQELERLGAMVDYCKTDGCLRGRILEYFGQPHPDQCGNCGNCRGVFTEADITIPAQMILSCVKRVHDKLGYYVGATLIVQVLRGGHGHRLKELGLDGLSTYGLMAEEPRERIRAYLDCLEVKGYVYTETEYSTLRLAPQANAVLFHGERVSMTSRVERKIEPVVRQKRERTASAPADEGLLSALKAERTRLARREGVPPYIIFSNAALTDMAAKVPRTIDEFLEVSGVGQVKAQKYGEEFLAVIAGYERENKIG